jgi:hypothetical protein
LFKICKSSCIAGVNDTSGKFDTGINNTGSKFATSTAGVIDIGGCLVGTAGSAVDTLVHLDLRMSPQFLGKI